MYLLCVVKLVTKHQSVSLAAEDLQNKAAIWIFIKIGVKIILFLPWLWVHECELVAETAKSFHCSLFIPLLLLWLAILCNCMCWEFLKINFYGEWRSIKTGHWVILDLYNFIGIITWSELSLTFIDYFLGARYYARCFKCNSLFNSWNTFMYYYLHSMWLMKF